MERQVYIYDTTLRDGCQRVGISVSLGDKLHITKLLDDLGVSYIEGGWPGSNPKDKQYFEKVRTLGLRNSKVVAFGSTRRADTPCEEDANLKALLDAGTPAVALVGKRWTLHVDEVLRTTRDENLLMIAESVAHCVSHGKEVVYDAEHFFDGFRADREYALSTVQAASEAGARWLVLCDTNGGSLPEWVSEVIAAVKAALPQALLGIHTHNDGELAVANSLAAVRAGCSQVQGTINGFGERCGNANLVSVVGNLQLKMGYACIPQAKIPDLYFVSRSVSEIVNLIPDPYQPFVGEMAFAHKGGLHGAAVERITASYEHIEPSLVGNRRQLVVSELAGRGNIRQRAQTLGFDITGKELQITSRLKELELEGFQFELADGSFELLLHRECSTYRLPFELRDMTVRSELREGQGRPALAVMKFLVGQEPVLTVAEGMGPVHALELAMKKALVPYFPELGDLTLIDYKVRIIDPQNATAASTRVLLEAMWEGRRWTCVGCAPNIIDASYQALSDSFELAWLKAQATAVDAGLRA